MNYLFLQFKRKPTFLLWLATFSFSFVINYLFFDFFTNHGGISAKSITITKNSPISELLDRTVQRQVNAHHKHINVASNFSVKLCKARFKINKLNVFCIGYCKFLLKKTLFGWKVILSPNNFVS